MKTKYEIINEEGFTEETYTNLHVAIKRRDQLKLEKGRKYRIEIVMAVKKVKPEYKSVYAEVEDIIWS